MTALDFRSDTVTRPSRAMREAMANAEVGDDVYGEDPTARTLEQEVAALLGKEAALFVPSGTMSNQIALLVQTRPGDEVILGRAAHMAFYESGAGAALAGVQFASVGSNGLFTADEMLSAVKPERDYHPRTQLVALENTHNSAGGRVFPERDVLAIAAAARELGLKLHLDGARLWNAAVAMGVEPARLASPFDTVSVCFSKGLGAPVGSALVGSHQVIRAARRFRKMLGGGMRQVGVLAAGALYALRHQRARLELDHDHARLLAASLSELPALETDPSAVETNIVLVRTLDESAESVAKRLAQVSVLVAPFASHTLRFVTHLDLTREDVLDAAQRIRNALGRAP
ncbi:MAG TPA: low-specificity L-threonine aldolase [Polyangiaceae bacterium]|nr:low-specificity L-threonine aldolase [Polyangiaceae bacterium]